MRPASPLSLRARKQVSRRRIRQRAPRHPVGPEAALRLAVTHLMTIYHDRIRKTLVEHARLIRPVALAAKQPHPLMRSVFDSLHSFGRNLLAISPFKRALQEQARKLAASVKQQVASALELGDGFAVDLSDETSELADGIYDDVGERMADSIERALDVFGEWDALGEDSPRAGDVGALGDMLDDGLDGILGTALQGVALAYGWSFADMNKSAQSEAGVSSYLWIAQHDSATRPEHLALDGETADWDDPPLSADDSSSGEPCHAGADYNCRCVASPIPPEGLPN